VAPFLPDRPTLCVLDVGAGTGIFSRAWPRWHPCVVIALESSPAMRAELVRNPIETGVGLVAGRCERLPLRKACIDVAWLSTVIHHFDDLDRCVFELERVLRQGGVVLIRGLFAEADEPPWLRFFPGWERTTANFPSASEIRASMVQRAFTFLDCVEVEEALPATVGEAALRARRLRHADSLLTQFSDQEILVGLSAMDGRDPGEVLPPCKLSLMAFSRRGVADDRRGHSSPKTQARQLQPPVGRPGSAR
jgi:SAM-dependent methyltransferase